MRIEITLAKTNPLPAGAVESLSEEFSKRIDRAFPHSDNTVSVRYASNSKLTVLGASKETRERISAILQETWESADEWFVAG